ncbi:MAG TPA: permease-like cell division protein FtsX [Burkholderiales bacterium]|nr:permease-like cell division protein FtsX [Burkholderiales bacterium]
MRPWLRHHRQALALALRRIGAQRSAALLNAIVIGVALALPAGGYALLANLEAATQRIAYEPQLSIFLRQEAPRAEAVALGARLKADARVREARFVPREAALKQLRATETLADVVAALGPNPLPDAFVIRASNPAPEALEALARDLRRLPAVAHVQVDSDWARRFNALATVGRSAIGLLAALLAVGLIAVTFNTIRLQILTQRAEIEVSRLIGATDAFIRRPLYYLGLLQGLAGGVIALAILRIGLAALNVGVADFSATYGSSFRLSYLELGDALAVAAFSAVLGWLGAYLSVSKYLREIHLI